MLDNMSTGTKYMERQTLYGFFLGQPVELSLMVLLPPSLCLLPGGSVYLFTKYTRHVSAVYGVIAVSSLAVCPSRCVGC